MLPNCIWDEVCLVLWSPCHDGSVVSLMFCCSLLKMTFEGNLDMTLLTYAPIGNLPEGVHLESAEAYLPWRELQKVLKLEGMGDRKIQVLADFIMGLWILVNGGGWRLSLFLPTWGLGSFEPGHL